MHMVMKGNTGLIAGLVVISVLLVVITLALVTIIIWNRKHNMRPNDKQDKVRPLLPLQIYKHQCSHAHFHAEIIYADIIYPVYSYFP